MNYNNCVRLKNTALAILLGGIIMKRYSAPITEENFSKASKFILDLFRKIKGKNRAYNIVVPLSTVIFIFLSSIFTYGAIYSFSTADDAVIFESLKPVTDIWLFFSDLLIQEGLAWYYNILIFVAVLFLVPSAISLIISVIFVLSTKKQSLPDTCVTEKDKASALHGILSEKSKKIFIDEEVFGWICTAVYLVLMVAFTVFSIILTIDKSQLSELFGLIIGALFVFAVLAFIYYYAYLAFYYMNTFACNANSIFSYQNDVYDYWCSVDSEEAKRNEERKRQEEAKKRAASTGTSSYAGMAYYEGAKKKAMRNLENYTGNISYHEFDMPYTHLEAKEALRSYLNSNASSELKEEAIKKFNNYFLDNYTE